MNLKKQIYFKQVYLVGWTEELLESPIVKRLLQTLVKAEMRPFSVYFVRNTESD